MSDTPTATRPSFPPAAPPDIPSAVHDPTPIRADPPAVAAGLAGILRAAAAEFRSAGKPDPASSDGGRAAFLDDLNRTRRVGQALIDARERGLIPASHPELVEVIDHHRAGGVESCRRRRGPVNLWHDVRGGHLARMHGPIGERLGGLLPRLVGGAVLHLSDAERSAAACEYLANLLDPPPPAGRKKREKPAAGPYPGLRRFAGNKLKGQERAVIEALCGAGGKLRIADLAGKEGVGWNDTFQGFKDVQRRLNPKLKPLGWVLARQDNEARLVTIVGAKVGAKRSRSSPD
jgi:hypothetical protein